MGPGTLHEGSERAQEIARRRREHAPDVVEQQRSIGVEIAEDLDERVTHPHLHEVADGAAGVAESDEAGEGAGEEERKDVEAGVVAVHVSPWVARTQVAESSPPRPRQVNGLR